MTVEFQSLVFSVIQQAGFFLMYSQNKPIKKIFLENISV